MCNRIHDSYRIKVKPGVKKLSYHRVILYPITGLFYTPITGLFYTPDSRGVCTFQESEDHRAHGNFPAQLSVQVLRWDSRFLRTYAGCIQISSHELPCPRIFGSVRCMVYLHGEGHTFGDCLSKRKGSGREKGGYEEWTNDSLRDTWLPGSLASPVVVREGEQGKSLCSAQGLKLGRIICCN